MKKVFASMLMIVLLCSMLLPAYAINFDISAFENDPDFTVEFDDMDDTGTISLVRSEDLAMFGAADLLGFCDDNDSGILVASIDIRILEDFPPVIRLSFEYYGEDWCHIDKFIVKPGDTRYTFEVDRDTKVEGGKIYEYFTLVLTPKSIGLIEDLIKGMGTTTPMKFRMDGDRDVNGSLYLTEADKVQKLLDAYIASGALDNDFTKIENSFPCTIK